MKRFLHAVATLSGLSIGVGIFGVPFVTAQVGFKVGMFWIALVGLLVIAVHLFYGEVVAATAGKHRLPGYVGRVMGPHAKQIVMITDLVRFWGLQLAYLIVGGTFLSLLLTPYFGGDSFLYSLILFAFVALSTLFGLRFVNRIEFVLTWFLLGAILLIVGRAVPHIQIENLLAFGKGSFFLPYGIIIVALGGAPAIPEMWDILRGRKKMFRAAILVGTLIPILVTGLFTFAIVGVTGSGTSLEAVEGLRGALGARIVTLGAFAGFLAILTSYLVIALYMQEMLRYDFLVKRSLAWGFAVSIPLLLFLIGAHNFIEVIDIIGSVLFGIEGIIILVASVLIMRRRKTSARGIKIGIAIIVGLCFALGVIQKLV
ncbi:MAG: aromatic amino acid transport family protein [bacterium]|nr:aromatic amino acid transport family protein [bacterium]